jgi:hypothetical protein
MKSRGLSLVGLLVALALFSVVTGSIYGLLTPPQRGYHVQTPHVELSENVSNALTVLSSEIRELDANDPVGGDIVSRTASSVTYRAVRNLYFVCQPPDPVTGQIVVAQDSWHGLRPIDPVRDWVLVLQENDPDTRQDDLWLRTDLAGVSMGTACPGSAPSLTLTVTNIMPTGAGLTGVAEGAPLRGFELVELLLDQDDDGEWWLALRQFDKPTGYWNPVEKLLGPLTSSGLHLTYSDHTGSVGADADEVASISIVMTGQSAEPVFGYTESVEPLTSQMLTRAALKNSRR